MRIQTEVNCGSLYSLSTKSDTHYCSNPALNIPQGAYQEWGDEWVGFEFHSVQIMILQKIDFPQGMNLEYQQYRCISQVMAVAS